MSDDGEERLFQTGVNEKFERILSKNWVKKVNSRNKKDSRLLVLSSAQLYLAKPSLFGNTYKICKSRPWVNLMTIETPSFDQLTFNFTDVSITIDSPYAKAIYSKITVLFQEIFGYSYRTRFHFNFRTSCIVGNKASQYIMSLFLSVCYSKNYKINVTQLYDIMKILKKEPHTLDFTILPQDKQILDAFLSIIDYTDLIKSIHLPGNEYFPVFVKLAAIAHEKKAIKTYVIENTNNMRGFEQFIDEISNDSFVTYLSFKGVHMTQQDIDYLILSPVVKQLETLKFVDCGLDETKLSFILKYGANFPKLKKLVISKSPHCFTQIVWQNLKNFLGISYLTKLVLKENQIDVYDALTCICNSICKLESIDLSGNNFDETANNRLMQFTLPETCLVLKLKDIKWSMQSLINIMFCQNYSENCELDVSSVYLTDCNWDEFFAYLEQFPISDNYCTHIIWKHNPLDIKFVEYLTGLINIESLDFTGCTYDHGNIANISKSMIKLFKELVITKFVMRGVPNHRNTTLLLHLLSEINNEKSLKFFDISCNILNDDCLHALANFIDNNKQLEVVNFAGCVNSEPDSFIKVLDALLKLHEITHVKNLKKDIKRIVQLFVDKEEEITKKWNQIKDKISSDDNKGKRRSRSYSEKSDQGVDNLNLSWNYSIMLPSIKFDERWDSMSNRYSLQALTGISV